MYTELQKARYFYDLRSKERDSNKRCALWDAMWDTLYKMYKGNMTQVCYVVDLFLYAYLRKEYGNVSCLNNDYKNHLLRGLDKFHW